MRLAHISIVVVALTAMACGGDADNGDGNGTAAADGLSLSLDPATVSIVAGQNQSVTVHGSVRASSRALTSSCSPAICPRV